MKKVTLALIIVFLLVGVGFFVAGISQTQPEATSNSVAQPEPLMIPGDFCDDEGLCLITHSIEGKLTGLQLQVGEETTELEQTSDPFIFALGDDVFALIDLLGDDDEPFSQPITYTEAAESSEEHCVNLQLSHFFRLGKVIQSESLKLKPRDTLISIRSCDADAPLFMGSTPEVLFDLLQQ